MNIVCVGGGPAGLYFAICTKLRNPGHRIQVFERGPEGVTYGWGFGFWDEVLDRLHANDPVIGRQVEQACGVWDGIEVHVADRPPAYLGGYGLSMSRNRLLEILTARARDLGVELYFEHEITDFSALDADLVVASDGINSALRDAAPTAFETSVDTGSNHYLWLGTTKMFGAFQYVFERTEAGWIWMHCYYLDEQRSTCVMECPPQTWHGLGLDQLAPTECLKALEQIFERQLDGHRLLSQLDHLDTVPELHGKQIRNNRWYHGNIALVGDAAHTTHFSIGSGTRLAIGDAEALAEMVDRHGDDVPAALRAYDQHRRPIIDHAQDQALNSMRFLEAVPERLDDPALDSSDLAFAISRRLGNRDQRWRRWMHQATQLRAGRWTRAKITTARRMRSVRARAENFAGTAQQPGEVAGQRVRHSA